MEYLNQFKKNKLGFVFLICTFLSGFIPYKNIFDYTSYGSLYFDHSKVALSWEPFFIFLIKLFNNFGISYESFRLAIKIFCTYALYKLIKYLRKMEYPKLTPPSFEYSNYFLVIFLPFFISEFFSIRLRVGIAIALFCYAIINCLEYKNKNSIKNLMLAAFFLILAFLTHKLGSCILSFFSIIPLSFAFFKLRKKYSYSLESWILFLSGFLVIFCTTFHEVLRGYNLPSHLHPLRFSFIALFPVAIFLYQKYKIRINTNDFIIIIERSFSKAYVCLSIILIAFFFFNKINNTGEAITRVFTLSSFMGIVLIGASPSKDIFILPTYLVLTNQLFFLHTLHIFGL